ncbi:MAG: molecular chaperone [Neisseriaceae bacterium]|nr:molecular chaperone [Neisseriaceae bacterium]MBP6861114.1 molecular chaperone [Neisseriaceae bacterium]
MRIKVLILGLLLSTQAMASVVITGTRVVYPGQKKEIGIELRNDANNPALVQSWIDYFDESKNKANQSVPFVVMPPVFRMEPTEGQSLRVVYTKEALPQDRESLFRFNVLEIPPSPEGADNYLLMAIRSQLKFFFRPASIKQRPQDVEQDYVWRSGMDADHKPTLLVDNPTPFYLNLSHVAVFQGSTLLYEGDGQMVAPKTTAQPVIRAERVPNLTQATTIQYTYINDFGARVEVKTKMGAK